MSDVSAPTALPASIVNALPASAEIMKHFAAIAKLIPQLDKELKRARKSGAPSLARAFVALHRMKDRIAETMDPLFGEKTESPGLYKRYKEQEIPSLFEQEGIKNVPLAEGFRVGLSSKFYASIKPNMKSEAYEWMRSHGLESLITETVNASSLSSAGKKMLEENNQELPEEIFNAAYVANTTVTRT